MRSAPEVSVLAPKVGELSTRGTGETVKKYRNLQTIANSLAETFGELRCQVVGRIAYSVTADVIDRSAPRVSRGVVPKIYGFQRLLGQRQRALLQRFDRRG